jgi:transcription initiation factor IIE alpha subunit
LQSLETVKKIYDDNEKDALLAIPTDRFIRKILPCIIEKEKSAAEISKETGISICTVYRKIQSLQEQKLVKTTAIITSQSKKVFLYQSRIKSIHVKFENGFLDVQIIPNHINQELIF